MMKKLSNPRNLLLVTLGSGIVGFLLQLWLVLATRDEKGLLRITHISSIFSFILMAAFLLLLFLLVRGIKPNPGYSRLVATGLFPAVGTWIAALGILLSAITAFPVRKDVLSWIVLLIGIAAAAAMAVTGLLRLQKKRPNALLPGIAGAFFTIYLLEQYRNWCKEPQLAVFFFPLLACAFLTLAMYHAAELEHKLTDCRRYVFFNRAAIVLCCLGVCHSNQILFISMALYLSCSVRLCQSTHS